MTRYRIRFSEEHPFNDLLFLTDDPWHSGWMQGIIVCDDGDEFNWGVEGIYLYKIDEKKTTGCDCDMLYIFRGGPHSCGL